MKSKERGTEKQVKKFENTLRYQITEYTVEKCMTHATQWWAIAETIYINQSLDLYAKISR